MHKKAPLPFTGQKRNFINHFTRVLNDCIANDGEGWTIVDAFGGSGLLSHVSKHIKPKATVIYNDYDGYSQRLKHIPDTNRLRGQLADILTDAPRGKKLDSSTRRAALACLRDFDGFVDMHAVSSWLLFSGNQTSDIATLSKMTLYNTLRRSDFPRADDYLQGLQVVKQDYATLLNVHKDNPKALFVLDPPYVCTAQGMYANDNYFGIVEFLRLMQLVRPPFIFFSSTRSEFVDYLDFVIDSKADGYERLRNYQRIAVQSTINSGAKYEDNLIYKF